MNYYTKNNKHKIQTAIALGYNKDKDSAPRILATGKGDLAEKILAIANQENIPVHQDEDLANILCLLEANNLIPVEVYATVAKILGQIYKFQEKGTKT